MHVRLSYEDIEASTFVIYSFAEKIPFFSLTHDLSHEILYAFGSVIKLICHFFHHLCLKTGRKKNAKQRGAKPAKQHLSSWWIIGVTSSLFKWNLKGLVKMITTIFHRPVLCFSWFLISFCCCHLNRNEPWMANANRRYGQQNDFFSGNFSHSWFPTSVLGKWN